MNVLGIVTARGGSKGIPGKNIKLLAGKPLIQYTAESALNAKRLSAVVLSTDDEAIANVGRQVGLEVPFLRPPELAQDDTPTLPVLRHVVTTLEEQGRRYDAFCLLQPTNPLRTSQEIDSAIDLLEQTGVDSVITVLPVPAEYNPHWVFFPDQDQSGRLRLSTGEKTIIPRRQLLPPAYHRSGSVYVMRRSTLIEQNSLYGESIAGLVTDISRHVNIDDHEDWRQAEALLGNHL